MVNRMLIIPLLTILIISSGCKNYLDIEPVGIVLPNSVEELGLLLIGDYQYGYSHRVTLMMSDELTVYDKDYTSLMKIHQHAYTWSNIYDKGDQDLDWKDKYKLIYNTNYVLSLIDDAALEGQTEEDRDRVKAEALTIRAYNYFELVNIYGAAYNAGTASTDLAVPLLLTDDLLAKLPRASVAVIYEQIIGDLKQALGLYTSNEIPKIRNNTSKTGAAALLARIYLYQSNWQGAIDNADLALANYNFLYDYNDFNKSTSAVVRNLSREDNEEAVLFRNSTSSYSRGLTVKINDDLLALFETADKRVDFFVGIDGDGNFIYAPIDPNNVFAFNGFFTPELYLTRAEANARLGNINDAMADLTTLRANRFDRSYFPDQAAFDAAITLSAASTEEAIQHSLDERRRELMLSGLRWFDMKRLADEGRYGGYTRVLDGQTYNLTPGSNQWVVDISPDIKEWNPKL